MGKSVFDYNDGDFIFSTSSLGFDSDGSMMMRLGDNMALEVDSGELHIVSSWENEEERAFILKYQPPRKGRLIL